MRLHTVGGVIGSGDAILDIVPRDDDLVIDARISPNDIDVVRQGQTVQVVLSAYTQRTLPRLEGKVRDVSADRIVDPQTQSSYYKVRVEVDREALAALGSGIELSPGMPAEVMVMTGQRTAFEYLTRPFLDSLRRSFTES
jgi:HlyD family secretion protein/epimerase transport system membrane fusion protein